MAKYKTRLNQLKINKLNQEILQKNQTSSQREQQYILTAGQKIFTVKQNCQVTLPKLLIFSSKIGCT